MRSSLFTIFSFQKNTYKEYISFVCYYYFPFHFVDDKLGKTFLSYICLNMVFLSSDWELQSPFV